MASVETAAPGDMPEERKSSMAVRTRKLGRRLSRSMSIVALKLPEKAQSLTRKSSKLIRASARDKKTRQFELSVILPDKTQRQVCVSGSCSVAEAVSELLRELGAAPADAPSAPLSAPRALALGEPLPLPSPLAEPLAEQRRVRLALADSRAPVDERAAASALEGEVLLLDSLPPEWDGRDLHNFIAWENIYASTLLSAVELYGKPLLRAAAITDEEYHLLFYYLQIVSEASTSLTERMQSYLDSGLLKNGAPDEEPSSPRDSVTSYPEAQPKSILNQLVSEGLLTQRDLDRCSETPPGRCASGYDGRASEEGDGVSHASIGDVAPASTASATASVTVSTTESVCGSDAASYDEELAREVSVVSVGGQCCSDHRLSSDVSGNVWSNVRWQFLAPSDCGYDLVRRSRSDSALSPPAADDPYETLPDGVTPYESIEDLYDCIKSGEGAPYAESCPAASSGDSDSTEYVSRLFPRRRAPPPPPPLVRGESALLLQQLFSGELADVYGEYLAAYAHARALLRRKQRRDEHFAALADIRRGAAKLALADYLELPIERLAQYERLVGGAGAGAGGAATACGRRRGVRLSDLERVQDLFPHDYLALHEHDALAAHATHATQKTKSLRKRPSLDLSGGGAASSPGGGGGGGGGTGGAGRTFVMEAPVTLRALSPDGAPGPPPPPPLERHLFLFSDLLLVGKARGGGCFKLKESVRLAEAWLALPPGDDTGFLLGWPAPSPATYRASYPTQAARDTWYRKLQNALNTQLASEPKATNIQVQYKDTANSIEFCKTLSVSPETTSQAVIRQALQVLQNNNVERAEVGAESAWGPAQEFTLWVRCGRDAPPAQLHGPERPHAVQMSRIRQTLSSEDGFDLEHVNAKNHPSGVVFELRKKGNGLKNTTSPGVGGRGLRLLRRVGAPRLFGVALARLNSGAPPPLVLQMLRRLRAHAPHTHGVFRRSANVKALRLLKDKLDTLGGACASCAELERAPVLLLAALLKDFFRSLPAPLLVDQLYHSWIAALGLPPNEKVAAVRSLLLKLPKSHYTMLTYFICLLQAIAKKSPINQMCPMNLGVCVGPSLLWPSAPCDKAPKAVPMVIELLIVKADALFGPQIGTLLGSGAPDASNLLDSGAEESDSLHSVGISLDSMELSSPRKEKLSLSRDSGLTLSEDDSNSNGGNSPAPRNILHSLSAPAAAVGDKFPPARRPSDTINVSGLPHISHYSKGDIYGSALADDYYASPYSPERYVHNSIDIGIDRTYERVAARREDVYGHAAPDYITGMEPQKPPRSNVSKAARTSKVYSMYSESQEHDRTNPPVTKTFNRAKSSDNLLDIKQSQYDSKLASSQENILYGSAKSASMSSNEQSCLDHYQNMEFLSNTNYSRVYTDWEKRSALYGQSGTGHSCVENIYARAGSKAEENSRYSSSNGAASQPGTIFTRNDWSRQAARTKSLEANEEVYASKAGGDLCHRRRADPAHMCSGACSTPRPARPAHPAHTYVDEDVKRSRHRHGQAGGQRVAHSKSLANIVLQSDSSSSDTLYVPQGSPYRRSAASSDGACAHYTSHYAEPLYSAAYDIYTAQPTAVLPAPPPHPPPPVPPRKVLYQKALKKFPPVHSGKEDRSSRAKSVPPAYRDPPNSDKLKGDPKSQQVLALDCSDTDTESESYV